MLPGQYGQLSSSSRSFILATAAAAAVSATNSNAHIGATIKTRTLEYRENLVTITDYSPGWSYPDVSIAICSRNSTLVNCKGSRIIMLKYN